MKISHNWLNQFINIPLTPEQTSFILTDIGLEVEKIEKKEVITGGLKGIVIGEVLSTSPHPNAEKLKLTKVSIGSDVPLNIVCGAPNVAPGQKVVVATVGAMLYPISGESFVIKKSKIRGEESEGMLCAEDEIGFGESHEGIMVLDASAKIGTPASDFFKLEDDWVYEIGLTPNRADAMSHWGVARDLFVALQHKKLIAPDAKICIPSIESFKIDNTSKNIEIEVENSAFCPRYAGITIHNIRINPSPEWLQNKLKAIGLNPINNVVDVTNYVLHELGQPLHAFDTDKIKGDKVIVKTLQANTLFKTLDGTERKLDEDDLMICNTQEGMCIGGIFGGLESGVTDKTTSIFLESAYFNPVSIRKTAKRHGLSTDASFRFERGIDPNITVYALKRAALLIKEVTGGEISSEIKEFYPNPVKDAEITFSIDKCQKLIGKEIPVSTIKEIISLLDIKIVAEHNEILTLKVPAYRNDVTREADITEEVLRIYGFNNIEIPEKLNASISYKQNKKEDVKNLISNLLSNQGFYEIMANSLTKSGYANNPFSDVEEKNQVALLNPLSSDLDVLRQTLLYNGLGIIGYNNNRQQYNVKFYEFGKTYKKEEQHFTETNYLSIYLTGKNTEENWKNSSTNVSFYDIKQVVENIFTRLGIFKNVKTEEIHSNNYQYGLSYTLNNKEVVKFGLLPKKLTTHFDCKTEVFYAQINWDITLALLTMNKTKYQELSKFPSSRRDLSLLIDKHIVFDQIQEIAKKVDRNLLKEVGLFDIYEGQNLEKGKKSYAVSFIFRDDTKTIQDKQVDKIMSQIQLELETKLGASLR